LPGVLYLVATPIGNLEDITFRAVRVLGEADLIACEDTRHTRKLLDHYGVHKPAVSYHEHNEASRTAELLEKLKAGARVALVSDAGTPLVSDPGQRLVEAAVRVGIRVEPVPGPSALVAALAASGLPAEPMRFGGFLPPKAGQRARLLESLAEDPATLIFYEAPHRILGLLDDVARIMPRRPVVVARELTKVHEEFLRGSAAELREKVTPRGEITLLIGPAAPAADETPLEEAIEASMRKGLSRMEAMKEVARKRGVSKREVYRSLTPPSR
jgi:16S rRNA (cytidine1402-2'-O)-methyltransferase